MQEYEMSLTIRRQNKADLIADFEAVTQLLEERARRDKQRQRAPRQPKDVIAAAEAIVHEHDRAA